MKRGPRHNLSAEVLGIPEEVFKAGRAADSKYVAAWYEARRDGRPLPTLGTVLSSDELVARRAYNTAAKRLQTARRSEDGLTPPVGNPRPEKETHTTTTFKRSADVVAWVLQQANGICEGCGQSAPFISMDGRPWLVVHHVIWLKNEGRDTVDNAVALCPNCHDRCHHSADRDEFTKSLYTKVPRLRPEKEDEAA